MSALVFIIESTTFPGWQPLPGTYHGLGNSDSSDEHLKSIGDDKLVIDMLVATRRDVTGDRRTLTLARYAILVEADSAACLAFGALTAGHVDGRGCSGSSHTSPKNGD